MTDKIIREWERRDDETTEEFVWFDAYRETRNKAEVIRRHFPGMNETAAYALIKKTERKNKWASRLLAYDRWIVRQRDDAVASMVQHEIGLIERKRARIIHILSDKVMEVTKNADASRNSKQVEAAMRLMARLNDVFDKMKASAPTAAESANAGMTAVDNPRSRLLDSMAEIANKQQASAPQDSTDSAAPVQ